jgi:thiosulfate dehydrogenase (quinone) large subunit
VEANGAQSRPTVRDAGSLTEIDPAPQWPLAVVRLYLGVVFVFAGVGQLRGTEPWGPATDWPLSLQQYDQATRAQMPGFYAGFFQSALVQHKDLVATLLPSIHVLIGVSLLLGVATRPAAAVALFCLVNYMAMTGVMPYHPDAISALAALTLAVLLTKPDQVWSVRKPGRRPATISRWQVVPLRLYIAGGFLLETFGRLRSWSGWHDEVQGFLTGYLPYAAAFYRPVMRDVALPHVDLFARLVFVGEAVAGLSFLFGAATRLGAGVGIFLSCNYLLSKGNTPWSVNNDFAFIIGMLAVALTRAGRIAGLDAWLARRWPRSWLW